MKKILAGILLALLCSHEAVLQAARTFGGVSTDRLATTYTSNTALTTWAIWVYRTGDGGGGFGRMFDKREAGSTLDYTFGQDSSSYFFSRNWTTTDGYWTVTKPATGAWHHYVVTYDSGAAANDPIMYVDGVATALSSDTTPVGTLVSAGGTVCIGNRFDNSSANWAGGLAGFGIWDVILNAGEAGALGRGVSPLKIRTANLLRYYPVTGVHTVEPDFSPNHATSTLTGTVAVSDPPNQSDFLSYGESSPSSDAATVAPFIYLQRRRR